MIVLHTDTEFVEHPTDKHSVSFLVHVLNTVYESRMDYHHCMDKCIDAPISIMANSPASGSLRHLLATPTFVLATPILIHILDDCMCCRLQDKQF